MRLLKLNNQIIDIDEGTVIAIDFQSYNIAEPSIRSINISNQISIPVTTANLKKIGYSGNVQNFDTTIYNTIEVNYWINNEQFIKKGVARIEEISDRIYLTVFDNRTIWDELKLLSWPEFQSEYLNWLLYERGYNINPLDFEAFITKYKDDRYLRIGFYYTNFINNGLEIDNKLTVTGENNEMSGRFSAAITSIFEFIEWKYKVNFNSLDFDGRIIGNLFADDVFQKMYIPLRNITVQEGNEVGLYEFLFSYVAFAPLTNQYAAPSKSLYDFVQSTFKYFNVLIDKDYNTEQPTETIFFDNFSNGQDGGYYPADNYNYILAEFVPTSFGLVDTLKLQLKSQIAGQKAFLIQIYKGGFDTFSPESLAYQYTKVLDLTTSYQTFEFNNNIVWLLEDWNLGNSKYTIRILVENNGDTFQCNFAQTIDNYFIAALSDETYPGNVPFNPYQYPAQPYMQLIKSVVTYTEGFFLRRFDDIENKAPVINFSDKFTGKAKFKPLLDGLSQNNRIVFDSVFEGGDPFLNSNLLQCKNKSLPALNDSFITISAHIPALSEPYPDVFVLNLSTSAALENFEFLYFGDELIDAEVYFKPLMFPVYVQLVIPSLYSLSGEYVFYNDTIEYPKYYEVKKWLSIEDIKKLEYFKLYWIRELNGSFFINAIKGFNPDKSNEATTLELFRVSDKVPAPFVGDYFVDGYDNIFTDGFNNFFY